MDTTTQPKRGCFLTGFLWLGIFGVVVNLIHFAIHHNFHQNVFTGSAEPAWLGVTNLLFTIGYMTAYSAILWWRYWGVQLYYALLLLGLPVSLSTVWFNHKPLWPVCVGYFLSFLIIWLLIRPVRSNFH